MVTITLPPELEQAVTEQAKRQGTTPELLAVEKLRGVLLPAAPLDPTTSDLTMADFFAGYVGGLHSSEHVPGGAQLSSNTGLRFKELLLEKYRKERGSC